LALRAGRFVDALMPQWKVASYRAGHPSDDLGNVVAVVRTSMKRMPGLQLGRQAGFVMIGAGLWTGTFAAWCWYVPLYVMRAPSPAVIFCVEHG